MRRMVEYIRDEDTRPRLSILNQRIRRAINVIADTSAVSPTLYKAFIRGNYLSIDLPIFFSVSLSLSGLPFSLSCASRGNDTFIALEVQR